MILVLFGLPASGKTFLADELAKEFGCVHFNTDIVRKQFIEKPDYSDKEKRLVYKKMLELSAKELEKGNCIILDGTFYRETMRKKAGELAKKYLDTAVFIELTVTDSEAKRRISERARKKKSPSDATFPVYLKLKKRFQKLKEEHMVIDSETPLRKQVKKVEFYLKRRGLIGQ